MTDLAERLKEFGKEMKEWEKKKTSVSGANIIKLPGDETNFGLAINPLKEDGTPYKRKDLIVTSIEQWEAFKEIFANTKAFDLMQSMNNMKAQRAAASEESEEEEVFEV